MKNALKKSLIYLLCFMMIAPISLAVGYMSASAVKAADTINEGFANGSTAPTGWTFTGITGTYSTTGNFGSVSPSIKFDGSADAVETSSFANASELSFWLKGEGVDDISSLAVDYFDGATWQSLDTISNLPTIGTTKTYPLSSSATKLRFVYTKSVGNLALDDVVVSDSLPNHNISIGSNYYSTIADALYAAKASDIIDVVPGTYSESLTVDKAVTIRSTGSVVVNAINLNADATITPLKTTYVQIGQNGSIAKGLSVLADNGSITIPGGDYSQAILTLSKPLSLSATGDVANFAAIVLASGGINVSNVKSAVVAVNPLASINAAIGLADESAVDGATVYVASGTYTQNVVLNKKITLASANYLPASLTGLLDSTGTNLPVIKSDSSSPALSISADAKVYSLEIRGMGDAVLVSGAAAPAIHSCVLTSTGLSIDNTGTGNVSADSNYFGQADEPTARVHGLVGYTPWYTDNTFATLRFASTGSVTTALPVAEANFVGGTQVLLEIPAGTTISGVGWDGSLNVGKVTDLGTTTIVSAGEQTQNTVVIEIGAGSQGITLTGGTAKITFVGKASATVVGFVDATGKFVEISEVCTGISNDQIPTGATECKAISGQDLIIVTTHFTKFVAADKLVTAPVITSLTSSVKDNVNYLTVGWNNTGASSYGIYVDGILAAPSEMSTNSATIRVSKAGLHMVKIRAKVGSAFSAFSADATISVSEIAVVQTSSTVARSQAPATISVAPKKASAAAPALAVENKIETPKDDQGIIKGSEDTTDEDASTNWTPWIILFVLIVLAGAATGGYFYWFAGKEEVAKAEKDVKIIEKSNAKVIVREKKAEVKPAPKKKSRRW